MVLCVCHGFHVVGWVGTGQGIPLKLQGGMGRWDFGDTARMHSHMSTFESIDDSVYQSSDDCFHIFMH